METPQSASDLEQLARNIKTWGLDLGFSAVGIADVDLHTAEDKLQQWLAQQYHGTMDYMARYGTKRTRPAELVPGTLRVISVRHDYSTPDVADSEAVLADGEHAFIARYALGRDYHKILRGKLKRLAEKIETTVGSFQHRVFTDSAPVMEVELAVKAGLGWRGKHTLLLDRRGGSLFFLGEIFTDLPLPVDRAASDHCGTCQACIDVCPTKAIVAPYVLDARRCISYLTIEHHGSIPEEFRASLGNRVYGCDDCQLVCPWNKFAKTTDDPDFHVRNGLDNAELVTLFAWSKQEFETRLAGSAIYRIGYERWLRNLAVGLGNASSSPAVLAALKARRDDPSPLVREHVAWALGRHRKATTAQ
ncbi:MAG: tRNA epoxyqueuosine(34) reductase QueG [Pseudomonadota bacterium]|nr:tRNA epoxyqueuosine(34) reductase QueG [Pseudomonadota bacterium]